MRARFWGWCTDHEVPTWLVGLFIYCCWLLATLHFFSVPLPAQFVLGGIVVAWHGSLQHETCHGHPTRWPWVNTLFGLWPLGLYLPYDLYRETHLAHHATGDITDPVADSESWYVQSERWAQMRAPGRALRWVLSTLLGRLVVGPFYIVATLLFAESARIFRGDFSRVWAWAKHALTLLPVLYWIVAVCGVPLWLYAACYAYPGLSLTLLRSFAEHRPASEQQERTAILEANWFWRMLYLNNNLHALHHAHPGLPWFQYRKKYERDRDKILGLNGDFYIRGYATLFRRAALRPQAHPVHPRFSSPQVASPE